MHNDFNQRLSISATETNFSDAYQIESGMRHVQIEAEVEAIAGAAPTVDITIQVSSDNENWVDVVDLPQQTATGTEKTDVSNPKTWMRFKIVTGGTFTSADIRLFAQAFAGDSSGKGEVTTLIDNVTLDDDPTSYTSDAMAVDGYSQGLLFLDIDSTGSPTLVQIEMQFSDDNGTTWYKLANGFMGSLVYEDTETASGLNECVEIPLTGSLMRLVATATGTDGSNSFDITAKVQPNL